MSTHKPQIIIGIDPGSNVLGYAFLQTTRSRPRLVNMGVLDMRKMDKQAHKLKYIFDEVQRLCKIYTPNQAAIEAPFYGKDVQAMLKLGRAQGCAMAAMASSGMDVVEYSPRSIKKAVTGKGNATKEQVARMLPHLIDGDIDAKFLDAYDALGVAFCHYLQTKHNRIGTKKYADWGSFLKNNPNRRV